MVGGFLHRGRNEVGSSFKTVTSLPYIPDPLHQPLINRKALPSGLPHAPAPRGPLVGPRLLFEPQGGEEGGGANMRHPPIQDRGVRRTCLEKGSKMEGILHIFFSYPGEPPPIGEKVPDPEKKPGRPTLGTAPGGAVPPRPAAAGPKPPVRSLEGPGWYPDSLCRNECEDNGCLAT